MCRIRDHVRRASLRKKRGDAGSNESTSTGTPGPIVDESEAERKYFPLGAFSGFAATRASITLLKFASSLSSPKLSLPKGACRTPRFGSVRSFTRPFLSSLTSAPRPSASSASVPSFFAAGNNPLGPSTRAALRFSKGAMSAVATHASNSTYPSATRSTRSSPPTTSAPAALATSRAAGSSETAATTTLRGLRRAAGSRRRARPAAACAGRHSTSRRGRRTRRTCASFACRFVAPGAGRRGWAAALCWLAAQLLAHWSRARWAEPLAQWCWRRRSSMVICAAVARGARGLCRGVVHSWRSVLSDARRNVEHCCPSVGRWCARLPPAQFARFAQPARFASVLHAAR